MADGARSSAATGIVVAVIGLVGSVAVAWITTQAKFSTELREKEAEVSRVKQDLDAAERRLADRQQELDGRVAALDERMTKLDVQIDLAQAAAGKLLKAGGGLLKGKKDGGP